MDRSVYDAREKEGGRESEWEKETESVVLSRGEGRRERRSDFKDDRIIILVGLDLQLNMRLGLGSDWDWIGVDLNVILQYSYTILYYIG